MAKYSTSCTVVFQFCTVMFDILPTDKGDAIELRKTVDEAVTLLADYNSRLSSELADRKKVAKMLRDYIAAQKSALVESENKLEVMVEYVHLVSFFLSCLVALCSS